MMAAVVDLLTKEAVVGLAGVVHLNITNMLEKKMNRSFWFVRSKLDDN